MDLNSEIEQLIAKAESERDQLDRQIRALRTALGQAGIGAPALVHHAEKARNVFVSHRGQRNATRSAILDIMADGRSRKVGEIARMLGKTSNATSAATRALRDSGQLVENGKQGYYKIAPGHGAQDPEKAPSTSAPAQEEALGEPLPERLTQAPEIVGVASSPGVP
jgi:biotin operon repressor